jgi:hypothetical protein
VSNHSMTDRIFNYENRPRTGRLCGWTILPFAQAPGSGPQAAGPDLEPAVLVTGFRQRPEQVLPVQDVLRSRWLSCAGLIGSLLVWYITRRTR